MHGCEKATHVALHTGWDELHEVGGHELGQASVTKVDERIEGINRNIGIHGVENGAADDVGNRSKSFIEACSGPILVGVEKVFREFETQLHASNLGGCHILLLSYKWNKRGVSFLNIFQSQENMNKVSKSFQKLTFQFQKSVLTAREV